MKKENLNPKPKKVGRPKKKATGGSKMIKNYRNKRSYLLKVSKKYSSQKPIPSIPPVITAASVDQVVNSIREIKKTADYENYRALLLEYATKVNVKVPDRPEHITQASVNQMKKLINKAQGKWKLKKEYAEIRQKISELPWVVRLPRIPEHISQRNVDSLKKLYDKYKDKAPKYRDKVMTTPEEVEESIKKLEQEAEEEQQDDYEEDAPLPPNATPEPIEDEVLNAFRDFVSKALDYTETCVAWHNAGQNWDPSEDLWSEKIYQHGMNCLALITKLELESDESKRKATQNLIIKAGKIYEKAEEYLFIYQTYELIDEGAYILQEIEDALREATGNSISDDNWKDWAEVQGNYGVMIDM